MNDLPVAGSVKPFHVMEAQAQGIPRLGVLRMDVDNLGKLFSEGLGERATLSRVASLSFAISLFFDGWVGHLAEAYNRADSRRGVEYGERLYSIYSGGDDLFFVGAWDALVELARQIRADLGRFCGQHPALHASGGMVLVGGKYPLAQAAEDAAGAEEQAKRLVWYENGQNRRKDAFCFLGQALPWVRFGLQECAVKDQSTAHALHHLLLDLVTQQPQASSLLRRLIRLHERYQAEVEKRRKQGRDLSAHGQPQALWGPWNWLAEYTLRRMFKQTKVQDIDDLRKVLKESNFRSIEWIGLAARWTELFLR